MNDLYAVELFSGAGGLSLGLNKAGFTTLKNS
jgi:site-specific DNA-cytosine methylase